MKELVKNLSTGWKTFIAVCIALPTIAGGIEGYKTIKNEIKETVEEMAQPYIQKQVKLELEDQKKNKETSYRFQKAAELGIPIDSLLVIDKRMYVTFLKMNMLIAEMDEVNIDRAALTNYLKSLSLYVWRELDVYDYKGVTFGYSAGTGLTFYMYKDFIFEAYHKGSSNSYWFKDSYGIEQECQ